MKEWMVVCGVGGKKGEKMTLMNLHFYLTRLPFIMSLQVVLLLTPET